MTVVEDLPVTRLLPNVLTLLSLCAGLTAMQMALQEQWAFAMLAIVIAAVCDVLDGRVARLLNIASKFGAELDSLADCVSFGVAPGFVLYLWTLRDAGGFGWVAVLVLAICTALRLARFNTMLEDHDIPVWAKSYFTGVPAPAGAGMAMFPLMLFLAFGEDFHLPPMVIAAWVILVGGLMVSRLPTLSLKGRRVSPVWVAPIMMGAGLLTAVLITNPWISLTGIATAYIASLPYGWYSYRKRLLLEQSNAKKPHHA
ncbi:MAG: phosphatidylcholine/phosphatidylserine synthase [Alphaproteobacteria bacterium]|nr:phosphatidylcholine/phosphatidylserine synthase [Alphaproteobacteria bacterium]